MIKKRIPIALLLPIVSLLISCSGDEEDPGQLIENEDITGEFQGRIDLANGEKGVVIYSFVAKSDDVYTGFYEGVEFGEITVSNGNVLSGTPTNGNTAFTSMQGTINQDRIFMTFLNNDGGSEAIFSGDLVVNNQYAEADVVINGEAYTLRSDGSSPSICSSGPLDYSVINSYIRLGGTALLFSTVFVSFENEPAPGTYDFSANPPSASTFNGDISYDGDLYDFVGGTVTVSSTDVGYNVFLGNTRLETGLTLTGNAICD